MSMASTSNNTPVYTPASSTAGSVLDDPPKTVLAIFFYHFTTFLGDKTQAREFTMNQHPVDWANILRVNGNDWSGAIRRSIKAIARTHDSAAKLLLVIFWSYILRDQEKALDIFFWAVARSCAVNTLFKFQNAPEQYLGWVKDVNPRNQGHLHDIVSEDGQIFFRVDSQGALAWLSESEGLELAGNTIGQLPEFPLKFV